MAELLLVEDDATIAKIILYHLQQNASYHIRWVTTATSALEEVKKPTDLILLDICLPDLNGVELCQKIRQSIYCPIIFISCLDNEETIVRALETGGDDYLTKPFSGKMLETHIEANLRRVRLDQERKRTSVKEETVRFGDVIVHCELHTLERNGITFHLAPIEFEILMYFIENPDRIISIDELYENIWSQSSAYGDVRTVVTHVYNLRKIVENDCRTPQHILNVRGSGYYFQK